MVRLRWENQCSYPVNWMFTTEFGSQGGPLEPGGSYETEWHEGIVTAGFKLDKFIGYTHQMIEPSIEYKAVMIAADIIIHEQK